MDMIWQYVIIILVLLIIAFAILKAKSKDFKLEANKFEIADIYKTDVCPLARTMRKELRKRNIKDVKVVYSKEEPVIKERTPASISYVPAICGMIIAGEVIKDILK